MFISKKNEEIFIPGFTKSLDTDENQKSSSIKKGKR